MVLLLNNLGSTTLLEMHAAAHAAAQLVDTQLQVMSRCSADVALRQSSLAVQRGCRQALSLPTPT